VAVPSFEFDGETLNNGLESIKCIWRSVGRPSEPDNDFRRLDGSVRSCFELIEEEIGCSISSCFRKEAISRVSKCCDSLGFRGKGW